MVIDLDHMATLFRSPFSYCDAAQAIVAIANIEGESLALNWRPRKSFDVMGKQPLLALISAIRAERTKLRKMV